MKLQKKLSVAQLRRELSSVATHVVYLDSTTKGASLGVQLKLSIEPGLKSVPSRSGRALDGYVVPDVATAQRVHDAAIRKGVHCEIFAVPSLQRLAPRLLRGETIEMDPLQERIIGRTVSNYLDMATTGMDRATHYNAKQDQGRAERVAHASMLRLDRFSYALLSCLPGLTDNSRKLVCWSLLEWPEIGEMNPTELSFERRIVEALAASITVPRMLQLFELLDESRCNNSRTRRVILGLILGSPKLAWWSVKYRRKLAKALRHAWGRRRAGIMARVCRKTVWTETERNMLRESVFRYADADMADTARECVAFILGSTRGPWTTDLLAAYDRSKTDLTAGRKLPPEVLEGIRSVYHPRTPHDEVLRLTARSGALTSGQKIGQQRSLERAGVTAQESGFDPRKHDAIKLYIYAYERGMTAEIRNALSQKASEAARSFTMVSEGDVVILDASKSMEGDKTQRLRPMASAQATADALVARGARLIVVGGKQARGMLYPSGDSSLALPLARAIRDHRPGAVYVISDGYDNAPAGRFAETVEAFRRAGVTTPIYHLNPVAAAEVGSVRKLAADLVPTLSVQQPKALGTTLLRHSLEQSPLVGLKALLQQGQVALEAAVRKRTALPAPPRASRSFGVAAENVQALAREMSPAMLRALRTGAGASNTIQALTRRGLINQHGTTDLGRQVLSAREA